jgi:hypothetical protein
MAPQSSAARCAAHDEVETTVRERARRLLAVCNGRGRGAVLFEELAQRRADFAILLDAGGNRAYCEGSQRSIRRYPTPLTVRIGVLPFRSVPILRRKRLT